MKRLKAVIIMLYLIPAISVTFGAGELWAKTSEPFKYEGYTEPEYETYTKLSTYISISDGTLIAADVFLPSGYHGTGEAAVRFPTVLKWTPYSRSFIDPASGLIISDGASSALFRMLLTYGYAIVVADMRGCGASTGWMVDFSEYVATDGKAVVDWIAGRTWSDGNVGMWGGSYDGISQIYTASQNPEALKCIHPTVVSMDIFNGTIYPGGIFSYAFVFFWQYGITNFYRNNIYVPGLAYPSGPAVDEDGDGEFADEIPVDLDGSGTFIDDYPWPVNPTYPPQYPDGVVRTNHYYFNATAEHALHPEGAPGNPDAYALSERMFFIDATNDAGYSYYEMNPSHYIPGLVEARIPTYISGGWMDIWPRGTMELFATLQHAWSEEDDRDGNHLVRVRMGPSYHSGLSQPWADKLGLDRTQYNNEQNIETLRWLDRWLKGVDNGIEKEDPILIFNMFGDNWRPEKQWPPAKTEMKTYHLQADDKLDFTRETKDGGTDEYVADFTHTSGVAGIDVSWLALFGHPPASNIFYYNRHMTIGGMLPDALPYRNEADLKCLTYTSDALSDDMEVTGHPQVVVYVSSTADYGDLYFYLEDMDEDGNALHVTDYQVRVEFTGLYDNDTMIDGGSSGVDVKPDLPWHGFQQNQYVDRALAGSTIVKVERDLHPISYTFKAGHKIRLSIAAADWPSLRLHPQLAPTNNPADPDNIVPTLTIHRTAECRSCLDLPLTATSGSDDNGSGSGGCFVESTADRGRLRLWPVILLLSITGTLILLLLLVGAGRQRRK